MANQNRRIDRQIRASVKKLKKGEIPDSPAKASATPDEEAQFVAAMRVRRGQIQQEIQRLSSDSSRRGHKRRLQLDDELIRLNSLPGLAE